jgi:2-polyprenyl-6-methoxyphenol hydroxylase-like FAD-dependent oxidoreductase
MAEEKYDIVIVGAGPVGLTLSACLARWGYKIKHIDNRPEPTATGRADGIQPRSLDLLRNMGLKRKIMEHEPAKVYEVAFWDPAAKGIQRTGTWASCPKFIDARYPFTTLLHQGLIERVFIEDMEKSGTQLQRPWTITGFKNDGKDSTYPVEVNLAHVDGTMSETVRAKYLFSGEGARSFVRDQLGVKIRYKDPIAHVWGVMDGVVRTNFPDIKVRGELRFFVVCQPINNPQMKCTIHSDAGSIMVIPRENNLVRLYIQVASSSDKDWDPRKTVSAEDTQKLAQEILKPYTITWDRVEWFSVYPIGQGIAERYTLDERVFMGGDACHTHSPKAGQGMNTAFLDAVNLAWKIHHVERGWMARKVLQTYESERQLIAESLLDFDAKYAKLFSSRIPSAGEVAGAASDEPADNEFIKMFKASCEFTSGYGVAYTPNTINWGPEHAAQHPLYVSYENGTSQRTGRILSPATVTRVVDANVVHLEQEIPLNGSYRLFIFGGALSVSSAALKDLATHMATPTSFFSTFLHEDLRTTDRYHEHHNPHSGFLSLALVFNAPRSKIHIDEQLPEVLARYADHVYADDVWDQRVPDAKAAAHAKMGLDQERGGIVVVRPDGYVGVVVKLVEGSGTCDALNRYFEVVTGRRLGGERASL